MVVFITVYMVKIQLLGARFNKTYTRIGSAFTSSLAGEIRTLYA